MKVVLIAAAVGLLVLLGVPLAGFYDSIGVYSEVVSIARDIIVALVATVGAFLGLGEWKRQFNAKIEHELARRVLGAVLALRDEMHSFRGGFFYSFQDLADRDVTRDVYKKRFEHLAKAGVALELERREAEVVWGEEVVKILEPLLRLSRIMRVACEEYFSEYHGKNEEKMAEDERRHCREQKAIIMGGYNDGYKGLFRNEIDKAAADIADWLRPKLRP